MEGVIGTIMFFVGNFSPKNWYFCNGQLLSIAEYQTLYAIIGTYYGGDGRTTFALPDLRGKVAIHQGTGKGLSPKIIGYGNGHEEIPLNCSEIPSHTHQSQSILNGAEEANSDAIESDFIAGTGNPVFSKKSNSKLNDKSIVTQLEDTGSNKPHENMQPFLTTNFIICVDGIFPQRS